jgi:hypothetical protein
VSDLPCDRQAGHSEGRNGAGLEAAACLEHNEVGFQHLKSRYKVIEPVINA